MHSKYLFAILPFFLTATARPAPQAGHDDRFDNAYTDSEKDGVFTLEIRGAKAYTGSVGDSQIGNYGLALKQDVPITLQVQRLKYEMGGEVSEFQTYQGIFILKTEKDTAPSVECSVTTRNTIPDGATVIWDITDVNNPSADVYPKDISVFERIHCNTV